jgi:hypothetical protein
MGFFLFRCNCFGKHLCCAVYPFRLRFSRHFLHWIDRACTERVHDYFANCDLTSNPDDIQEAESTAEEILSAP